MAATDARSMNCRSEGCHVEYTRVQQGERLLVQAIRTSKPAVTSGLQVVEPNHAAPKPLYLLGMGSIFLGRPQMLPARSIHTSRNLLYPHCLNGKPVTLIFGMLPSWRVHFKEQSMPFGFPSSPKLELRIRRRIIMARSCYLVMLTQCRR